MTAWKLVPSKVTEDMHVAACKVLTRAHGLDGTPQRMLDAMLAAAPSTDGATADLRPRPRRSEGAAMTGIPTKRLLDAESFLSEARSWIKRQGVSGVTEQNEGDVWFCLLCWAERMSDDGASGSPARQGAEPSEQDLNPVSVSASASPATKEQQ